MGRPARIYHLALRHEWEQALSDGTYRRSTVGRSLEEVGFIHCSLADQVQTVADAFYHGREDVILLDIEPSRVPAEIREENLDGGDMTFPHIYGPLPVAAVMRAAAVGVGGDGRLLTEPLLADR